MSIPDLQGSIVFPLPCIVIPTQSPTWFSWVNKASLPEHTARATMSPKEYLSHMTEQDYAQQEVLSALFQCSEVPDYLAIWLYAFAIEAAYYRPESAVAQRLSDRTIEVMAPKFRDINIPKHIHKLLPGYISVPEQVVDNESYINWAVQEISAMLAKYAPVKHGV